ncbi:hypothetical protein SAICODRAFT_4689 [Saitoella complicata NRRL Y-17804]|uniref:Ribosome quality control complex subunit 2 n=1 Tax=Saitoella complicata (strain BCRC 22490 / CBS 7301 / JCM 7358 / NBRC 10748 / NRRL Y-17804) TaxID=698492 RepID=A0A0E9N9L3_SAICN|nr:uncharacterized protein SAICODRAFT_4689 [Saitoella complicata NRRL Y-17804]ODQ56509.1 hypothetical protein SAICODRAFT_4689 [Saitoella complicata NRRL Y-17804]GAO46514.1 hypothetical protein G7K_0744-t1 [Saitoella complicata NRRL Y-17804]
MKQRLTSLDIAALVPQLTSSIVDLRLQNIYDLSQNSRSFLFKFAKPEHKQNFLVESGFRCHLTTYDRDRESQPGNFCTKLRKHLRTRRLTSVRQLRRDRVLILSFEASTAAASYHLILEFYAAGNVVLVDGNWKIIGLLRVVSEDEGGKRYAVGEVYDLGREEAGREVESMTKEKLEGTLEALKTATEAPTEEDAGDAKPNVFGGKQQKKQKQKAQTLKRQLAIQCPVYGPALVEHTLLRAGIEPTMKITPTFALTPEQTEALLGAFGEADAIVKQCAETDVKGYIIAKRTPPATGEGEDIITYEDFHPFLPTQFTGKTSTEIQEVEDYNKTVDTYFSHLESQSAAARLNNEHVRFAEKLSKARSEHAGRIEALKGAQDMAVRKAAAIEGSLGRCDEAMEGVRGLMERGMDWRDIQTLIDGERSRGNEVAMMVAGLDLGRNVVKLRLAEEDDEDDDEESEDETDEETDSEGEEEKDRGKGDAKNYLEIEMDIGLSAYANARLYYDKKRSAATKEEKTLQASSMALKSTEKRIAADLKKSLNKERSVVKPMRKVNWFEKFLWFISSDGYLVLGGRDMQQNELLVRKYLKRGDAYVHADLHGAATVIVKNHVTSSTSEPPPIPPTTLTQAGTLTVCTSRAWDAKQVTSAYWVYADQVSKTAPTGEYLTTGSFMIRGKKNFLPPVQLVLGFGVLWLIDEESRGRHVKHRIAEEDLKKEEEVPIEEEEVQTPVTEKSEEEANEDVPIVDDGGQEEEDEERGLADETLQEPVVDAAESPADSASESEDEDEDAFPDTQIQDIPAEASADSKNEEEDKYALEDFGADEDEQAADADGNEGSKAAGGSKYISAKQRREMRKQKAAKGDSSILASAGEPGLDNAGSLEDVLAAVSLKDKKSKSSPPPKQEKKEKQAPPPPKKRGQKAKQKKIAEKYKFQDDEDREVAMKLLGSANKSKKQLEEEERQAKRAEQEAAQNKKAARQNAQQGKPAGPKLDAEAKRLLKEENIEVLDEEEQDLVTPLDAFTPTPFAGDNLLDAIPVCAPYSALARYKYKVKFQPGPTKKGKAAKSAIAYFTGMPLDAKSEDVEMMWPKERDLMKGLKDTELIMPIGVSKVKVSTAGKQETKGKGKGKKGGKKEKDGLVLG